MHERPVTQKMSRRRFLGLMAVLAIAAVTPLIGGVGVVRATTSDLEGSGVSSNDGSLAAGIYEGGFASLSVGSKLSLTSESGNEYTGQRFELNRWDNGVERISRGTVDLANGGGETLLRIIRNYEMGRVVPVTG